MKKIILFAVLTIFIQNAVAQRCKVRDMPPAVMQSFNKAYPNTKTTSCGKDSANYQISFYDNNAPTSVTYDATGKFIIKERQIPAEDLPKIILEYMKKNYPGQIFHEVAEITFKDNVVTYEIQVKNIALVFDEKGNFLQEYDCTE